MQTKIVSARRRDTRNKSARDASLHLARQMNEESGITQDLVGAVAQDLPQGVAAAQQQVDALLATAAAAYGGQQAQRAQQAAAQAQQIVAQAQAQQQAQTQRNQLLALLGSRSLTNGQKWTLAFVGAILFFILALPFLWNTVGGVIVKIGGDGSVGTGTPSLVQVLVHAVVFLLVFRLLLW